MMNTVSVYIHIPFCRHRCAYCDFNTYAGQSERIPAYVDALLAEIQCLGANLDQPLVVHTLYFGGGTPSLLPVAAFERLLQALLMAFQIDSDAEITIEANPGTLSLAYLQDLYAAGINRLSLGMQSAHPGELTFLERQHQFIDVISAVKAARQAGFANLSLDLIFGLPAQRLAVWARSLNQALNFAPQHFSLYALTLEPGTPMHNWAARGLIPEPNPDLVADMYELACERLAAAGYLQYEISNWAKANDELRMQNADSSPSPRHAPRFACRHNLQYWHNRPYLGLGAGAHGFIAGLRTVNMLTPRDYVERLSQPLSDFSFPRTPATLSAQVIDRQTEMSETLMMGLRLTRTGVSRAAFQTRFDQDMSAIFRVQIDRLTAWDLLEWVGPNGDVLRLTPKGRLLGNRVFSEFV